MDLPATVASVIGSHRGRKDPDNERFYENETTSWTSTSQGVVNLMSADTQDTCRAINTNLIIDQV